MKKYSITSKSKADKQQNVKSIKSKNTDVTIRPHSKCYIYLYTI